MGRQSELPDKDSTEAELMAVIKAWLPKITPDYLRHQGWVEVNTRRHELAANARIFANKHYAAKEQDRQRDAFFNGITFALLGGLQIDDIQNLTAHLMPNGDNFGQQRIAPPKTETLTEEGQEI